jgi:hypothetical protein
VPAGLLATGDLPPEDTARPPFWKQAPAVPPPVPSPPALVPLPPAPLPPVTLPPVTLPPVTLPPDPPAFDIRHDPIGFVVAAGSLTHAPEPAPATDPPLLTGFPLGDGVILLVSDPPPGLDRDDLAAAARPLLDLLASRALTNGRNE